MPRLQLNQNLQLTCFTAPLHIIPLAHSSSQLHWDHCLWMPRAESQLGQASPAAGRGWSAWDTVHGSRAFLHWETLQKRTLALCGGLSHTYMCFLKGRYHFHKIWVL